MFASDICHWIAQDILFRLGLRTTALPRSDDSARGCYKALDAVVKAEKSDSGISAQSVGLQKPHYEALVTMELLQVKEGHYRTTEKGEAVDTLLADERVYEHFLVN